MYAMQCFKCGECMTNNSVINGYEAKCACFTGHRLIPENHTSDIKAELQKVITSLSNQGINTFLNGGAMGFDVLAAEAVIAFKSFSGLPLKLIMVLPCKGHEAKWNNENKMRLLDILKNADETIYLSERYYDGCMQARNKYLVERSSVCVAYMKHGRSGTSQTVRMAREQGLAVLNLAEKF